MKKNEFIIESALKERLAMQCMHPIKLYAREKMARDTVHPVMKRFIARLIRKIDLDLEFSVMVTLCFGVEFESIKKMVTDGKLGFYHMSFPDYWEGVGHNVDRHEAMFFLYTFCSELYPDVSNFVREVSDRGLEPLELEREVNKYITTNE